MNKKQKANHKARIARRKARAITAQQSQPAKRGAKMLEYFKTEKNKKRIKYGAVVAVVGGGSYAFIPWFTEFVNSIWNWLVGLLS